MAGRVESLNLLGSMGYMAGLQEGIGKRARVNKTMRYVINHILFTREIHSFYTAWLRRPGSARRPVEALKSLCT